MSRTNHLQAQSKTVASACWELLLPQRPAVADRGAGARRRAREQGELGEKHSSPLLVEKSPLARERLQHCSAGAESHQQTPRKARATP